MNVIQWKNGARQTGSAEPAYEELETIRKREGGIAPSSVVKRAKSKRSALHRHFEWNDGLAAEKHRMEQARDLIRSIEIIHVEHPKAPAKAYSIVTTPTVGKEKPKKVYQSTVEALKDPVMRDEILGNAIRDAISFRRKYAALQELAQVFTAVDSFINKFKLNG